MSNAKAIVEAKIAGKKVMVFSKSYCPFCKKAKKVFKDNYLNKGLLDPKDYEELELDNVANGEQLQAVLKTKYKLNTVPQVFIKGKPIGGGTETEQKHASGELRSLLTK